MQPYFFPYIGYWQLIHAVDRFIVYDDVNYIIGGWINRNRILINGQPVWFTAPLRQPSFSKRICDTFLNPSTVWRDKLVKMVEITYRKAPCFDDVFPVVEKLIRYKRDGLSDYLSYQLETLSAFIGINTEFLINSRCIENNDLTGQERIVAICKREGASTYINPKGGLLLYDAKTFHDNDINLRFIVMRPIPYRQRSAEFIPYLSIIDALMAIGPLEIKRHLEEFDLVEVV